MLTSPTTAPGRRRRTTCLVVVAASMLASASGCGGDTSADVGTIDLSAQASTPGAAGPTAGAASRGGTVLTKDAVKARSAVR